jgi:hypothetical protein
MKMLSVALLLALLPAQEKITLKFNPKKGDKLSRAEKVEMSIKAKVTLGEQEQEVTMDQKESQKATLELSDVAAGAVTRMVMTCSEHVEERKGPPNQEWVKKEKGLHGRTITMTRKDGKIEREGADGLDDKTLAKLDLDDRTSRIFPKDPVAPGDTWELQGDDVRKFLGADNDLQQASIKVKLLSVKEIEGKKCAILNALMDLGGKAPGNVDLTMKLDAEVVVWIERGYALSVKAKGNIDMKADNPQFKMKGEGPMTLEILTKVE